MKKNFARILSVMMCLIVMISFSTMPVNAATKKPCSHITTVITDANAGLKVVATKSPNTSGAYIQKYNQATKKMGLHEGFLGT